MNGDGAGDGAAAGCSAGLAGAPNVNGVVVAGADAGVAGAVSFTSTAGAKAGVGVLPNSEVGAGDVLVVALVAGAIEGNADFLAAPKIEMGTGSTAGFSAVGGVGAPKRVVTEGAFFAGSGALPLAKVKNDGTAGAS